MTPQGATLALTGVENFILLNIVLSLSGFSIAAGLRTSQRVRAWHPHARARLYAAALVLPPVIAAWLVCASLLPALWLGARRWQAEHESAHTSHLLNTFTISLDPALGYATFVFITLAALVAAYVALSAYFRIGRVIQQLEIGVVPADADKINAVAETCDKHGIAVGLVASDYPFSFVWGYLNSELVVSTGLLNALSAEELAGVLEHEAAHHARRDNLAKQRDDAAEVEAADGGDDLLAGRCLGTVIQHGPARKHDALRLIETLTARQLRLVCSIASLAKAC